MGFNEVGIMFKIRRTPEMIKGSNVSGGAWTGWQAPQHRLSVISRSFRQVSKDPNPSGTVRIDDLHWTTGVDRGPGHHPIGSNRKG